MLELRDVPSSKLPKTLRLIKDISIKKRIKILVPNEGSMQCYYHSEQTNKDIMFYNSVPQSTSYAAAKNADNKFATYTLLGKYDVLQMTTLLISDSNGQRNDIESFIKQHKTVVVKPLDAGHGNGVVLGIRDIDEALISIEQAKKHSQIGKSIIQAQFVSPSIHDLRITCIDYKFCAAIERIPAYVKGDGIRTVLELIDLENSSGKRGVPYKSKISIIDTSRAKKYLGDKYEYVPENNEIVPVLGVANYGAGGLLKDITDNIPEWLKQESERIANICQLPVAGIDFLASNYPQTTKTQESFNYVFNEINKSPSLAIHDEPHIGKSRGVTEKYLEYIISLANR